MYTAAKKQHINKTKYYKRKKSKYCTNTTDSRLTKSSVVIHTVESKSS